MEAKIIKRMATAAACMLSLAVSPTVTAQEIVYSDDKVYVEDFSISPGESKLLEVWMTSTYPWHFMYSVFEMPEGLEFEVISPEELDTELFSFEPVYDPDNTGRQMPEDECMAALSKDFANIDFWTPGAISYWREARGKDFCSYLYFDPRVISATNEDGTPYIYNGSVYFNIVSEDDLTFNGTYRVILLKVHATEDLAEESYIKFHETFFLSPGNQPIVGSVIDTKVYGKETITKVMRRPAGNGSEIEGDMNGDGIIDVEDVNALINTILKVE